VIRGASADDGGGMNFDGLPGRGGEQKTKDVCAADARLAQIEALKIGGARVLVKNDVLITRGRAAGTRRIEGGEPDPGFDSQIRRVQKYGVGDLNGAVRAIEIKS